ncbi:MAG: hypothetical protein J07HN4v3_01887 [Halonotius sp. J07HN4]|nr:MAG: hypothetical protein J07HN4v3_01887 [Halonotius sp. J07HN4]
MAQHDYNLPSEWEEMSDEAKSRWYTQERCRRQAMRQDTPAGRALKRQDEAVEQDTQQREDHKEAQATQDTETTSQKSHVA